MRTVCRPARTSSDSGGIDGSSGPDARVGLLDCEAREGAVEENRVPREAVAERDEVLDAEEVYVYFGDGPRFCLVKLVNAARRNV